jgi:hypothetical protein
MSTYKEKVAVALHYDGEDCTTAAVIKFTNHLQLTALELSRTNNDKSALDLFQQTNTPNKTLLLGEENSSASIVSNINLKYLESNAIASCNITEQEQWDYLLSIDRNTHNALVVKAAKEDIDQLKTLGAAVISNWQVALYYLTVRLYPDLANDGVWVLHKTKNYLSLLRIERGSPLEAGELSLESEDFDDLIKVFTEKAHRLEHREVRNILLSGNWTPNERLLLPANYLNSPDNQGTPQSNLSWQVIPFDITANNYISLDSTLRGKVKVASEQWAVAVAGALMRLEGIGPNLIDVPIDHLPLPSLCKQIPSEWQLTAEQNLPGQILYIFKHLATTAQTAILNNNAAFAAPLILALAIGALFYYLDTRAQFQFTAQIAEADSQLAHLQHVKEKYTALKQQEQSISDAIAAINNIQLRQRRVETVFMAVNRRIPSGIIFTQWAVEATNVAIQGVATEKKDVFEFANQLGQSSNLFGDVVPTYDEKTGSRAWSLTTNYLGTIPTPQIDVIKEVVKNANQ